MEWMKEWFGKMPVWGWVLMVGVFVMLLWMWM